MKKALVVFYLLLNQITTAQSYDDQVTQAADAVQKKEYCKALGIFQTAFKDSSNIGAYEYLSATAAAANCKNEKQALVWLRKSQQNGLGLKPGETDYVETDSAFFPLHHFKEWKETINDMKQALAQKQEKWLKTVTSNCVSQKQQEKFSAAKNGFALYYVKVDSFKVPYLIYIPKTYNASKPTQAVVYLHGGVVSANAFNVDELITGEPIFLTGDTFNSIIIYPFGKKDFGWVYQKKAFENVLTIVKQVQQTYNIDEKRIYLGGMSNGGTAAFWFAAQKPNMFKGFYAFSANPKLEIGDINFKNMSQGKPFYSMNAKDDQVFNYNEVEKIYLQQKATAKDWHFETLEKGDHGFIYDADNGGTQIMNALLRNLFADKN